VTEFGRDVGAAAVSGSGNGIVAPYVSLTLASAWLLLAFCLLSAALLPAYRLLSCLLAGWLALACGGWLACFRMKAERRKERRQRRRLRPGSGRGLKGPGWGRHTRGPGFYLQRGGRLARPGRGPHLEVEWGRGREGERVEGSHGAEGGAEREGQQRGRRAVRRSWRGGQCVRFPAARGHHWAGMAPSACRVMHTLVDEGWAELYTDFQKKKKKRQQQQQKRKESCKKRKKKTDRLADVLMTTIQ